MIFEYDFMRKAFITGALLAVLVFVAILAFKRILKKA